MTPEGPLRSIKYVHFSGTKIEARDKKPAGVKKFIAGWISKSNVATEYPRFCLSWIITPQGGAPKVAKLVYNSNNFGF